MSGFPTVGQRISSGFRSGYQIGSGFRGRRERRERAEAMSELAEIDNELVSERATWDEMNPPPPGQDTPMQASATPEAATGGLPVGPNGTMGIDPGSAPQMSVGPKPSLDSVKQFPREYQLAMRGESLIDRRNEILAELYQDDPTKFLQAKKLYAEQDAERAGSLFRQAESMFRTGSPANKRKAMELLVQANSMYPNGQALKVMEKDGEYYGVAVGLGDGQPSAGMPITADMIGQFGRVMSDPKAAEAWIDKRIERRRNAAKDQRDTAMNEVTVRLRNLQAEREAFDQEMARNPDVGTQAQLKMKMDRAAADYQNALAKYDETVARTDYIIKQGELLGAQAEAVRKKTESGQGEMTPAEQRQRAKDVREFALNYAKNADMTGLPNLEAATQFAPKVSTLLERAYNADPRIYDQLQSITQALLGYMAENPEENISRVYLSDEGRIMIE